MSKSQLFAPLALLVLDALEAIFILSSEGDNYSDSKEQIRHQIFLGNDAFVAEYQAEYQ
jgi:hypothetical protein